MWNPVGFTLQQLERLLLTGNGLKKVDPLARSWNKREKMSGLVRCLMILTRHQKCHHELIDWTKLPTWHRHPWIWQKYNFRVCCDLSNSLPPSCWFRTGFQVVLIISVINRWILCNKSDSSDCFLSIDLSVYPIDRCHAECFSIGQVTSGAGTFMSVYCYDIITLAKKKIQDSVNISSFFVDSTFWKDAQEFNF